MDKKRDFLRELVFDRRDFSRIQLKEIAQAERIKWFNSCSFFRSNPSPPQPN
jgi:hypothetical protein